MVGVETVAVLVADLVGSTEMTTGFGPKRAELLRRQHFGLVRAAIEDGNGRDVKTLDDRLMAVFANAAAAVSAAVAIQRTVTDTEWPGEGQVLALRMGVSIGAVDASVDDYSGLAVVEASSLCDLAEPNQILIADQVVC